MDYPTGESELMRHVSSDTQLRIRLNINNVLLHDQPSPPKSAFDSKSHVLCCGVSNTRNVLQSAKGSGLPASRSIQDGGRDVLLRQRINRR